MHEKFKPRGFTLVEILVVITVVGLIFAGSFVAYGALQSRNRNDRRRLDIESIRQALNLFYTNQPGGYYPLTLDELEQDNYIEALPDDPSTGNSDVYINGYQPLPPGCTNIQGAIFCSNYQITITLEAGEGSYIIRSESISNNN